MSAPSHHPDAETWLAPFGLHGFVGVWVSASAGSFARTITQLALSWITLEITGSPFLVGLVLAVRMVPQMLLGIPAGVVADWFDRRTLTVAVNVASALVAAAIAGLAAGGLFSVAWIVCVSVVLGALDTLRITVTQAYAYDLVRATRASNGLALTNLGAQLLGSIGGLVGGYALERYGAAATFILVALAFLAGATLPSLPSTPAGMGGARPPRARPDLWRALRLLARNRLVAILALTIVLAEILGFSNMTLLPTFAQDVFDIGASGLGTMLAVRSAGGVLSLLLLARLSTGERSGALFLAACASLGLALLTFAWSPIYGLALVLLAIVGAASSALDTLGQTLLQRSAEDRERGAAMGIWVFSVGFGPIGHLALGTAAGVFGASMAQAASGALLALVAAILCLHRPLRRAR
ncbi:MAG: MFS transporter [Chloroflexi bacterium]|nr:MFS transporter [Chloroflexota bacterium]